MGGTVRARSKPFAVVVLNDFSPLCNFIRIRFVELQPRAKTFYGFKEDEKKGKEMMQKHAEGIVHLFDSILQMLGKYTCQVLLGSKTRS